MPLCEWNPVSNAPASYLHGCQCQATVICEAIRHEPGYNWRLCEECSKLPRFEGRRKRPIKQHEATEAPK